jgi:predicted nucleic acid-binding protein
MGIILDSGFLFALKFKQDDRHSLSLKIFNEIEWEKYEPIVTTNLVVAEVYTLVNVRTKSDLNSLEKIEQLFWGNENFFEIMELNAQEFQEIGKFLMKYSNKNRNLSFTDASLIYLAFKFEYFTIISFDSHFDGIMTRISN